MGLRLFCQRKRGVKAEPGNVFHFSKAKSFKRNIIEQNEYIKKSNNVILELILEEQFKVHDLISRIETTLALLFQTIATRFRKLF